MNPTPATSTHLPIAIIGTGFGGLGMAVYLKRAGIEDFTILERAADVGGAWRDNTYPGCACDVESHLYSFSFAPNPKWSRMFSPQAEIWKYLRECAHTFGLVPHIRFGHEVIEARWDETAKRWVIQTTQGTLTADVFISGMGTFSDPMIPNVPGLASFKGKAFHSARWDHSYDLAGKRVAVIGTGASAIQFVPAIQAKVGKLHVLQRTPPWIMPRMDRAISPREHRMFASFPIAQKMWRKWIFSLREILGYALRSQSPKLIAFYKWVALGHLAKQVTDPVLRKKLTPDYTIGCKRILVSNDYFPALAQPNVEVITDEILEIRPNSIAFKDGSEREIDAILFGTGFKVPDMPYARRIFGKGGIALGDQWEKAAVAHVGTTIVGFPNLFILQGPNTGLGHSSVVQMMESQMEHATRAITHMRAQGWKSMEPTPAAQAAFIDEVAKRTAGSVWSDGGCVSWYLDKEGRNVAIWPGSVPSFHKRVANFVPSEYGPQ